MEILKELGNGGIILIKKNDITTLLLLEYLNVNYSHIGFYYKKNNNYNIIVLNVIQIIDSNVIEYDLLDYLNHNDIIHYKKLNKTGLTDHFNNCIKQLLNIDINKTKSELILDFFEGKLNSFISFNQTLCKIDTSLSIINNSYLLESNYFDVVKELKIKSSPRKYKEYSYFTTYKIFLDIINSNPNLINKIVEIINNRDISTVNNIFIEELSSNYFYSSNQVFQDILNGLRNKKLRNIDFINHLKLMSTDFENLTNNINNELNNIDIPNEDFIFVPDNKSRIIATNNIKNIINNIKTDIKGGNIPIIKLNKLIFNFNTLIKHIDSNYRPIDTLEEDISVYAMITAEEYLKDIPLQLKNGDKILIPMNETNYSRFTKDQLDEMLILLDIYASGNNKFDQIRANITKELSNK